MAINEAVREMLGAETGVTGMEEAWYVLGHVETNSQARRVVKLINETFSYAKLRAEVSPKEERGNFQIVMSRELPYMKSHRDNLSIVVSLVIAGIGIGKQA